MARPAFTCTVQVQPLPEQTDEQQGRWAYAYTVKIRNSGDVAAQLVARHWIITDARGHVEEVRGLAVVGHQPLLQPGQSFEYTSWAAIATPQGSMRGSFFCFTKDARPFDAAVPEFLLGSSSALH
jgi:ApaG protein